MSSVGQSLARLAFEGWGFDRAYERLFVNPYRKLAAHARNDVIDRVFAVLQRLLATLSRSLVQTQTGRVRTYAAGVLVGAILCGALVLANAEVWAHALEPLETWSRHDVDLPETYPTGV